MIKNNWKKAFMDAAVRFSQESYAKRLKVGAIIIKNDRIISIGINGMPSGWDNDCETVTETINPTGKIVEITTKSKPEVLHAETNAIAKLARGSESGENASIFITHSPCLDCAKLIYQAGISNVYYKEPYRSSDGINFLKNCNLVVEQLN